MNRKKNITIIIIAPWFQACIYWKKVCYMTTSFKAIHFFYDSVNILWEHLKQSTCLGNCLYFTILFATIHYNKRSAVDSRKSWRLCLFEENHGSLAEGSYLFHSPSCNNFCLKSTVLNAQKHLQRSHSFMVNQHSEMTFIFSKKLKHGAEYKG